jgi:hypothetical protein
METLVKKHRKELNAGWHIVRIFSVSHGNTMNNESVKIRFRNTNGEICLVLAIYDNDHFLPDLSDATLTSLDNMRKEPKALLNSILLIKVNYDKVFDRGIVSEIKPLLNNETIENYLNNKN